MVEVCYGNLTYLEIKEKAEQDYIVIIPIDFFGRTRL